jgi:glycosyltransferase involved in cell wall biosynthesis
MSVEQKPPALSGRLCAVSVCMATYNGAAFVREQVASILQELGPNDELVVVDDGSVDGTCEILERFVDSRIRIYRNPTNLGPTQAFCRALELARSDVVFMADQDDVWIRGRINQMLGALERSGAVVVSSNSSFIDRDGGEIAFAADRLRAEDSKRHLANIVAIFAGTAGYYGCAMAVRRSLISLILPMPNFVESHDLWIALAGNLLRRNAHISQITLQRRVHGGNASIVKRSLYMKLRARGIFILSIVILLGRMLRGRGVGRGK